MQSRKILAEGLVLSRLKYLLLLWGGTANKYINKAQVIINKAARSVTGMGNRTSELAIYFTLTETWRIINTMFPVYMHNKLQCNDQMVIGVTPGRLQMTRSSFRWRASSIWNTLKDETRKCKSLPRFKKLVRSWLIASRSDDDDSPNVTLAANYADTNIPNVPPNGIGDAPPQPDASMTVNDSPDDDDIPNVTLAAVDAEMNILNIPPNGIGDAPPQPSDDLMSDTSYTEEDTGVMNVMSDTSLTDEDVVQNTRQGRVQLAGCSNP